MRRLEFLFYWDNIPLTGFQSVPYQETANVQVEVRFWPQTMAL